MMAQFALDPLALLGDVHPMDLKGHVMKALANTRFPFVDNFYERSQLSSGGGCSFAKESRSKLDLHCRYLLNFLWRHLHVIASVHLPYLE